MTDSAGIRMVQNGYVDLDEVGWRISDEPMFRIGWDEGDQQFSGIAGGFLTDAGEAVVVDSRPWRLVVVSPEGEVVSEFGREGQGPGELRLPQHSLGLGDDSTLVFDGGNMRFSVFHRGELAREVNLRRYSPMSITATSNAIGHLSGGHVVFAEERSSAELHQHEWGKADIFTISPDGTRWDTIGTWDVWPRENLEWEGTAVPVGYVGASGEWAVTARGDRPEVRWWDRSGVVRQIARWQTDPLQVSDELREAYVRWQIQDGADTARARTAAADIRGPLPYLAAERYNKLQGDAEGNVWIQDPRSRYTGSPSFYVLSVDGRWLGRIDLPPRTRILAIDKDRLLVVERNVLDVDAVALYGLVEGPGYPVDQAEDRSSRY